MNKVRYAIIGAGSIAQIAFLPSAVQTSNSVVTAIISGNAENAQRLAEFYGIDTVAHYDQYNELLRQDLFDAVYIALPNSMHMDYAVRSARAGKHVLVEKPLALTGEECEAMIDAAKAESVNLMTAYRVHHDPATTEIFDKIHSGAIGTPRYFSSVFSFQTNMGNHRLQAAHWGGPLQDIGVYCLNCARNVFGAEPIEVSAMTASSSDERFKEIDEVISVILRFDQERMAQFTVSFGATDVDSYEVIGSDGRILVSPAYKYEVEPLYELWDKDGNYERSAAQPCDQFGAQTEYFSDCILKGEPTWLDPSEGMADVIILRAIETAAQTGKAQKIDLPAKRSVPTAKTARVIARTDRRLVL